MPVTESPSYHGYDVIDYYNIDEEYGTNEDFKQLVAEANKRGIRVIVDLDQSHRTRPSVVPGITRPDSDKRDWYIWRDEDPGYRGLIISKYGTKRLTATTTAYSGTACPI